MLSSNVLSPTRRALLAGIATDVGNAALKAAQAVARAADLPTTIAEAGKRFRSGDLSSLDLTKAYLAGIEKLEPQLNAFIAVLKEGALKTAAERDAELRAGRDRGPLYTSSAPN
jgi:aspartyl-tRNA(Asn)/glutamyl-tRNA(Gln) amidotransferase subunit A